MIFIPPASRLNGSFWSILRNRGRFFCSNWLIHVLLHLWQTVSIFFSRSYSMTSGPLPICVRRPPSWMPFFLMNSCTQSGQRCSSLLAPLSQKMQVSGITKSYICLAATVQHARRGRLPLPFLLRKSLHATENDPDASQVAAHEVRDSLLTAFVCGVPPLMFPRAVENFRPVGKTRRLLGEKARSPFKVQG
jgi:hypothetical protein